MTSDHMEMEVRSRPPFGWRAALGSGWSLGAVGLMTLATWLLAALGHPLPVWINRGVVLLAVGWTIAWVVVAALRLAKSGPGLSAGRLLLGILVLSFAVRLIGIDHEVAERYYLDEGTYYKHATKINEGEVLRTRFVYPHLLYYLYAVVLWAASLFPTLVERASGFVFGVRQPLAVEWLLMRATAATLSALSAWPVFRLGQRIQGRFAAVLAGLLLICSTLYNGGSHLLISDVPSAVFAAFALYFAYRVSERESTRHYLLAGLFSGLAAATKYPAGVVAIAVVAVWIGWRVRSRSWSWGLLWAGLSGLGGLIAVMPSLLAYPKIALFGGQGIFFGTRQYGKGGWIGVMPSSNLAYYIDQLFQDFRLPLFTLALAGAFFLGARHWRRLAWLAVFPLGYVWLISAMNMVVKRNLFPALPGLAVILAVLVSGLWMRAATLGRLQRPARALVVALALALPLWNCAQQTISLARPGTRILAREWVREAVPRGAYIAKESYTPDFSHAEYLIHQARFLPKLGLDLLRDPKVDVVLASSSAYMRFFNTELFKPHHEDYRQAYEALFSTHPEIQTFEPSPRRDGPIVRIFRAGPFEPDFLGERSFAAAEAFVPREGMLRDGRLHFTEPGQWCVFKEFLHRGRYALELRGEALSGKLRVYTLDNRLIAEATLPTADALDLPEDAKYLFDLELQPRARLDGLRLSFTGPEEIASPPASTP